MSVDAAVPQTEGQYVRANGIDIHYLEAGEGPPLLLLHGGVVSTNRIWAETPFTYTSHMTAFATEFRVIAPDTRGAGRTVNPGGPAAFTELADDVVALIEALGLDRPAICGFSEGGLTATIVGIRRPDAVRAIVNDAGYDYFNPEAPSFAILRQMLGGSPESTHADPEATERFFGQSPQMRRMLELMKEDHDGAQGPGYWKTYLANAWDRTTRSPGYTFEDLRGITAPTLILTGDRDDFCSVEEAVTAFRKLQHGELAILPNHGHHLSPAAVQVTIDFVRSQP